MPGQKGQSLELSVPMNAPPLDGIEVRYGKQFGLQALASDPEGRVPEGTGCCKDPVDRMRCQEARQRAIAETLRWGEPYLHLCPGGRLIWAVPLMNNAEVLGGVVSEGIPLETCAPDKWSSAKIRTAADTLVKLCVEANATNGALLELRRLAADRESKRAEAIHELKTQCYDSIRDIYLKEEPGLLASIKQGDRRQAREILNRVLVGIYFLGRDRPSLLKSFLLELVVMMSRSAVVAGAEPSELLGANYSYLVKLSEISDEADLSAWLVSMLERIMDSIKAQRRYPNKVLLSAALQFMEQNLSCNISRDEAATAACMSPSHFSRLMKETFGRSFTELLAQMRIDKSKELLKRSDSSIVDISLECGFSDQSYFTKVFQRLSGVTPREYRVWARSSFR